MKKNRWIRNAFLATCTIAILQGCNKKDDAIPESEMLKIQESMMEKFRTTTLSSDPDDDFSTLVLLYNETAIAFAKKELELGSNQRMRSVAQEVIAERTSETDEVQKLIKSHVVHVTIPDFKNLIQLNVERAGKNASAQATTGNIDKDFAAVIIAHNQSVIENATLQLAYGVHEPLKTFGKSMVEGRDQQTRYLQAWLIGNQNPD